MRAALITLIILVVAGSAWACNPTTYVDCSPSEMRAIQQQQFNARKIQQASAVEYWRDRQYLDRLRSEDRAHELEIERIRAEAEVEAARNEARSWRGAGYYYYRPPVVIAPRPVPPIAIEPKPVLRGPIYSNTQHTKVPNAVK